MKYVGQITMHIEMCCGAWPQFHDDRGLHGDNNQYWNWDWTINFGKQTKIDNLKIWDKEGNLLYDDSWTYSRDNTCANQHYIPCPIEMDANEWLNIMYSRDSHFVCEVETEEVLPMKTEDRYK